eukprot:12175837-Ditylum_brightwellii.AAC.1
MCNKHTFNNDFEVDILLASQQKAANLHHKHLNNSFLAGLKWDKMPQFNNFKRMMAHATTFSNKGIKPLCLAARASAINNPNFTQAMNGPNAD